MQIKIYLDYYKNKGKLDENECWIEIPIDEEEFKRAVVNLRSMLAEFPAR